MSRWEWVRSTLAAARARHAATRPPSFRCPVCGAVSYHPQDVEHGYCGRCHRFTAVRPGNTPGPVS